MAKGPGGKRPARHKRNKAVCLSTITEVYDPSQKVTIDGWKVFGVGKKRVLESLIYNLRGAAVTDCAGPKIPRGRWLRSVPTRLRSFDSAGFYTAGFHIWMSREAARKWAANYCNACVVRVRGRGLTAKGQQCDHNVAVCEKMQVLPAVKRTTRSPQRNHRARHKDG